jgi:outer membrane receptor protein involved in Fe transport
MYVTYSKGYRPGGVNRFANAPPFNADFLKNYEIGWKTSWFDNHVRFNGALYYEKWDNFQFTFSGPNSASVIANAAKADAKGIESELEWAVTGGLTVSVGGAFNDAQLRANYCGELDAAGAPITTNPCPGKKGGASFAPLAPDGQQLPLSPRWKGNLTARYTFPLLGMDGHVQGNYTYQSFVWPSLLNSERNVLGQQGAYGIANFTFGIDRDNYTLDLIVKNAFDVRGSTYRDTECSITVCGNIATYNQIIRPRLIGLQFGQRF